MERHELETTMTTHHPSPFIEKIARVTHEVNRAIQISQLDPAPSLSWDDAPEWQRESARQGVFSALAGATPEQLHESWLRFKADDGWSYGEVKDEAAKTHPCFVPYEELPPGQRLKDYVFQAVVTSMNKALNKLDQSKTAEEATIRHSDARFREIALSVAAQGRQFADGYTVIADAELYRQFLTGTEPSVEIEGHRFTFEQAEAIENYVQYRLEDARTNDRLNRSEP